MTYTGSEGVPDEVASGVLVGQEQQWLQPVFDAQLEQYTEPSPEQHITDEAASAANELLLRLQPMVTLNGSLRLFCNKSIPSIKMESGALRLEEAVGSYYGAKYYIADISEQEFDFLRAVSSRNSSAASMLEEAQDNRPQFTEIELATLEKPTGRVKAATIKTLARTGMVGVGGIAIGYAATNPNAVLPVASGISIAVGIKLFAKVVAMSKNHAMIASTDDAKKGITAGLDTPEIINSENSAAEGDDYILAAVKTIESKLVPVHTQDPKYAFFGKPALPSMVKQVSETLLNIPEKAALDLWRHSATVDKLRSIHTKLERENALARAMNLCQDNTNAKAVATSRWYNQIHEISKAIDELENKYLPKAVQEAIDRQSA